MRYLTVEEFADLGALVEVNRQLLHPVGLALEVSVSPDVPVCRPVLTESEVDVLKGAVEAARRAGTVAEQEALDLLERLAEAEPQTSWLSGVWDCRDDPEGVVYGLDDPDATAEIRRKHEAFNTLWCERASARSAALGFVVQDVTGAR